VKIMRLEGWEVMETEDIDFLGYEGASVRYRFGIYGPVDSGSILFFCWFPFCLWVLAASGATNSGYLCTARSFVLGSPKGGDKSYGFIKFTKKFSVTVILFLPSWSSTSFTTTKECLHHLTLVNDSFSDILVQLLM
jgi:hypothetical protein